ncbi:MAG: 30S ribosomal protein S12 methylthiotransferase RimO [Planctomycetes bacterium]|nr:30S ribosomal protein S12 methylthiotransferase RimO [Planctomycetota bacterium]
MRPLTVHLVSLGCPKNLVDSEVFLGDILAKGFRITPTPELADVLMVNTCAFIDSAKAESIDTILELCAVKAEHPEKKVVVAGCLAQRYSAQIAAEIPEVDAIIGLSEYGRMAEILRSLFRSRSELPHVAVNPPVHPAYSEGSRLRLTPPHSAYLRISEGCDNPCTFCAIPSFRGRFRSKTIEAVVAEAEELVSSGATELNLISQDLTSYGFDFGGAYLLAALLERLNALSGVRWIRLLYTYPYKFSDEMIGAVADLDRVVKYIDMPIQHIHDRVLRRMGRRMGEAGTRALFERMRARIPGLVLRTTFIVGFPGETEEEFQALVDFVGEARIERAGVFTYSDEDGTPAVKLDGKIPGKIAEERRERIMLAQQEVAFRWNAERVGSEVDVLVDGADADQSGRRRLYGRSYAEAPEIDSRIYLPDACAPPGAYLRARVTAAAGYDLVAEPTPLS